MAFSSPYGDFPFAKRDSTKPKKPSTQNDTWHYDSEPDVAHVIDSSIINFEEFNPIYRNGAEYVNTGNLGSAAFPLVFDANRSLNFNVGYNQFDLYRYVKDSIKYYKVIRPYTELQMVIGLKNEQFFQGKFANQHKNIIFYGLEFRRIFSKGIYTNQRTNDNGFYLYGIYESKDKAWHLKADILFNAFKVQENGGVADSVFEKNYLQKTLVPVQLTDAENNYKQTDFYLKGTRNIGKRITQAVNDSTRQRIVVPQFSVSYQLNIEKNLFKFRDFSPSAGYYGPFYLPDSVFNDLDYLKIGNAVMLDYNARKVTSDSTFTDKNITAHAEVGFDYFLLTQNKLKNNFGNMYVMGEVRNNAGSGSAFLYKATAKYFLYGYNQHDLMADAALGYDFGKWGNLHATALFQQKEAPYIFENYTSHPVDWHYVLPKMQTLALGAKYQNLKWGVTADANYYWVKNLPIYPGVQNPYGTGNGKQQNILVAHVANRHAIKGFHVDNDIWFSYPSAGYVSETYPMFFTRHSVYYEARAFKKALWISTGTDIRFRYQNNPPFYDPLLGQFYPTFSAQRYTLRLDYFLNFKIRTVRIFAKVENLLAISQKLGHYSLFAAPASDFSFKAGLNWRFFE